MSLDLFSIEPQHQADALARVKNGTYGICRVTGNPIDPRWMALVPHATLSIDFDKFIAIRLELGLPITPAIEAAKKVAV